MVPQEFGGTSMTQFNRAVASLPGHERIAGHPHGGQLERAGAATPETILPIQHRFGLVEIGDGPDL